ncbi:uncharacterized protein N7484_008686 [Penicillium longicatenatum]|uniref:uncharacterized protein n=1 Tax=Penicillium longicatenatum TaxID=1561947 RepID=UPI002548B108|nr:uncharacterized protein N7484_008686 [Penicillium longicatenatum]KAJ5635373.1 hypothetical protein N7484_008686 [Penicillium longicatenatum]
MARFNLSFLAVFLVLAICAVSLPTKRGELLPTSELGLDKTIDELKSATRMMNGLDNKDSNDDKNQVEEDPAVEKNSAEEKKAKTEEPTKTEKKLTSGKFASPTPTSTNHPTSVPNSLGKLPIVGTLLGGTGGL